MLKALYRTVKSLLSSRPQAADLVVTEFFYQGDQERTLLKSQPTALMDREKRNELPRLQIQWIDGICWPLYKVSASTTASAGHSTRFVDY